MPAREFIDSNIWLYALMNSSNAAADQKRHRARDLLNRVNRPVINSQVVREVCSNLLKKAGLREEDVQRVIRDRYLTCDPLPSSEQQHLWPHDCARLRRSVSGIA